MRNIAGTLKVIANRMLLYVCLDLNRIFFFIVPETYSAALGSDEIVAAVIVLFVAKQLHSAIDVGSGVISPFFNCAITPM